MKTLTLLAVLAWLVAVAMLPTSKTQPSQTSQKPLSSSSNPVNP